VSLDVADRVEELYKRYGRLIYARCKRLLRDPEVAEDATQEVFVKVLRYLERIPDDEDAIKWLYRVTTNYCLNYIRDQARRTQKIMHMDPVEDKSSREQELLNQDTVRVIIEKCPKKLAEVAMLYFLDDLDQKQVAKVLDITPRTVINRLNEFKDRAGKIWTKMQAEQI
jgi:RNA polymerase sigma-70 factor (ECF subfamily)